MGVLRASIVRFTIALRIVCTAHAETWGYAGTCLKSTTGGTRGRVSGTRALTSSTDHDIPNPCTDRQTQMEVQKRLDYDVLQCIVDHSASDTASLYNCSLVDRRLSLFAARLLYRKVVFSPTFNDCRYDLPIHLLVSLLQATLPRLRNFSPRVLV